VRRRDPDRAARLFLRVFGALFLPVFALPLLLHPYRWARAFGWREEPVTDVGLYFGRQPPVEHAEIAGYAAVALLARRVRPRA
jgi:hypothetical protein